MKVDSKQIFQRSLKRFLQSLPRNEKAPRLIRVDTPLFTSGLIRSIEVLDLIVVIEELTGREIADQDVTLQNLKSIQAISAAFWEKA